MPVMHAFPTGVQRAVALCRGLGCPQKKPFSLFCSPPQAAREVKEVFGDTPNPGREIPAPQVLRTFSKVRVHSYSRVYDTFLPGLSLKNHNQLLSNTRPFHDPRLIALLNRTLRLIASPHHSVYQPDAPEQHDEGNQFPAATYPAERGQWRETQHQATQSRPPGRAKVDRGTIERENHARPLRR